MITTTVGKMKKLNDTLMKLVDVPMPIESSWKLMNLLFEVGEVISDTENNIAGMVEKYRGTAMTEDDKAELGACIREYLDQDATYIIDPIDVNDLKGVVLSVNELMVLKDVLK